MHYDERGAAFYALGYARATGRPAAWITTSGSAVANGLPAVVEADGDHVPMLLLTADRPAELRKTGANQTIDQRAIFQPFVRWSFDVPAPTLDIAPEFVLTTVDQAHFRSVVVPKGPVHLNCAFREPLVNETAIPDKYLDTVSTWQASHEPYTEYLASPGIPRIQFREPWTPCAKTLVIAGRLARPEDGEAILRLAFNYEWPLIADPHSQVRLGVPTTVLMDSVGPALEALALDKDYAPEEVIYFGQPAVSRSLQRFLTAHQPPSYVVVHEGPERLDPALTVTRRIQASVTEACRVMRASFGRDSQYRSYGWLRQWEIANACVRNMLEDVLDGPGLLSEPFAARAITRLIPAGHTLVLASSMPVRLVDQFGASGHVRVRVAANRGASGIDGTLATAAGVAQGSQASVTVILGDLAFLHDLNSLALVAKHPVTVVVINNDGGGIFHLLDIPVDADAFEQCFGTPHGLKFRDAASQYGISYVRADSREAFETVYSSACASRQASIIEVPADRQALRAIHQELMAAARESVKPAPL